MARARELGMTVFDTAEIYGFGRSERILGAALRAGGGHGRRGHRVQGVPGAADRGGRAAARRGQRAAARACARSTSTRCTSRNPVVGDATTMRGMRALRDVGVVDEVGVSNYKLRALAARRGRAGRPVLSNQVQFSLVARGPMADMLPWAQRTGHLVMAYSPLAPGPAVGPLLRAAPTVRRGPRGQRDVPAREPRRAAGPLLALLREVGDGHGVTAAQIGAGLARAPAERRGDPRGVQRRPGGEQRGGGRRQRWPPTSTGR